MRIMKMSIMKPALFKSTKLLSYVQTNHCHCWEKKAHGRLTKLCWLIIPESLENAAITHEALLILLISLQFLWFQRKFQSLCLKLLQHFFPKGAGWYFMFFEGTWNSEFMIAPFIIDLFSSLQLQSAVSQNQVTGGV